MVPRSDENENPPRRDGVPPPAELPPAADLLDRIDRARCLFSRISLLAAAAAAAAAMESWSWA